MFELKWFTTTCEKNRAKTVENKLKFGKDNGAECELINIYPSVKYQTLEGFGGAITDSAGYVFSQLNETQKKELLRQYFGRENMRYRVVRIPIDSCDFSLEHFEADSDEDDINFKKFTFERVEKYILPFLDEAENIYGEKIQIMLSPWSPPAYMKTNRDRNHGGKLRTKYKKRWAEYICRYIEEYRNRGYKVTMLTLQNEPKAVQTWDSCVYTAEEQKEFLKDYMWPALVKHSLTDIDIYIWDHNKERIFEWADAMIDEETTELIAGIAFHWYSGDHFEALRMVREKYPEKKLLLSEACIEYSKYGAENDLKNAQKYAHDMIGNLNNGMSMFIDWNLILNENGGPNHVGNYCAAPYLYHEKKKKLIESDILSYIWHFSHFIEKDSVRVGVSSYTDLLEVTAFEKDDKIVWVILNRTKEDIPAFIRIENEYVKIEVPQESISSGIISKV